MWRKFSLQFAPCVLYSVQCSELAARRQKFKRTPEWWRRNDLSTGSFYNEPNLVMVLVITEFWDTFINFILKWSDWRDTIGSITVDFIITLRFRIYVLENSFFGYPKSLLSQASTYRLYCWRWCGRLCHRSTQKHQVISQIFFSKSVEWTPHNRA